MLLLLLLLLLLQSSRMSCLTHLDPSSIFHLPSSIQNQSPQHLPIPLLVRNFGCCCPTVINCHRPPSSPLRQAQAPEYLLYHTFFRNGESDNDNESSAFLSHPQLQRPLLTTLSTFSSSAFSSYITSPLSVFRKRAPCSCQAPRLRPGPDICLIPNGGSGATSDKDPNI